ncbi:MAG TPA: insulinase family protein [Chitinophagaceae bacterium]|nr:insulinase family protein [Chitinophagaceae bacterium]HNU13677.1 insulinase family protein [Chitinophagaceae bacterium]
MQALKRLLVLSLLGILSSELPAQINPSQLMPVDPKVKIGRLSNGLTYYIRQNKKPEQRVELRLVVNTGSVLEDDDQQGLAHFMEHMNFNGTKRFPKNELVSYLQSIGVEFGADLNAYTSFDETVYMLPVPTDKPGLVEKGLQILEDWAHNALLDSLEIEKERGVVIEEWRLSRGAEERMMKQTLPVQYQGSKYAERLPIGKIEILQSFSHAALKRFYKDWYRPDLQAVIVVGDIDVSDMEQKIKEIFGDIPAPSSPRKREIFTVPDHAEVLSVVAKDKETAFPSVEVLFKKEKQPEATIGDYVRYMNGILFTSMLNNRFREVTLKPNPPFVGAGSYYGESYARTKDAYQLFANTSDTGMSRSLYALMEENRRVSLYGFTASEFDLQKKQIQSYYDRIFNEREKEESYKYVDEYVGNFLVNEPIPGIEWEYDFVKQYLSSVTLQDINKLAAQWTTKNNMVVTLNAPDKPGIKIPSAEEVKNVLSAADMATIEPYKEKVLAASLLDPAKLKVGKVISSKQDDELGTTVLKLSNGATVVLKPTNFKNDEIIFRAFSKGGHSLVKDADYYSAINAAPIVSQSGVGDFSAIDLGNMLKGKNTALSPSIAANSEGMSGNTIPKETETLLQLIHLYFTAPRKDAAAFESFKTRQKQLYANVSANPQIYFSAEFQKIMTQNHPRGGALPKPEDFDKISLDRSIQIYKERFANAGDFTFLFTGSFNEETIKPLLEKYIGSLPGIAKKETFRDLGIRPPKTKVNKVITKGADPKSVVNIVFTGPAVYSANDAYALRSLGELMDIKLVEQLREEKGGVYGVSASGGINRIPYSNYVFNITFPCAPDNADTLTDAAIKELKKIITSGVSTEDLEKIKEQQKRKLEVDIKQNSFWSNNLFDAYFYGSNPSEILNKQKMIDSLSSKMIQDAAKKYINLNSYIRATLKPDIKQEEKPLKAF